MLLPATIKAFVLRENIDYKLMVDLIQDVDDENESYLENIRSNGLEELILPDGHVDLLEALIKTHKGTRMSNGKGQRVRLDPGPTSGKGKVGHSSIRSGLLTINKASSFFSTAISALARLLQLKALPRIQDVLYIQSRPKIFVYTQRVSRKTLHVTSKERRNGTA
jgi:hypothetical protein